MTRRRERKQPPIVNKYDEHKSYGINFKLDTKDAFISYLNCWLEFDYSQEIILCGSRRILTLYHFTKPDFNHPFKMMVITNAGLKVLQRYCEGCTEATDIAKRLHVVFQKYMPDSYPKIKYYITDLAHYLELKIDKAIEPGQCSCLLLRLEYFTHKTIWEYLSDVAFTKTDDTVSKYQLFG